jgi:hypothetical protein
MRQTLLVPPSMTLLATVRSDTLTGRYNYETIWLWNR